MFKRKKKVKSAAVRGEETKAEGEHEREERGARSAESVCVY